MEKKLESEEGHVWKHTEVCKLPLLCLPIDVGLTLGHKKTFNNYKYVGFF